MQVVYFAEGSLSQPQARMPEAFERIWVEFLPDLLGLPRPARVVPINKKHLLAMDPDQPPMSSFNARLDDLIARELKEAPFDIAVVVWDLVPPWYPTEPGCRWRETCRLYRGMVQSRSLPESWRRNASLHLAELEARPEPGLRRRVQPWRSGEVFAVCMDPMFEILLTLCEPVIREALGVGGQRLKDWPRWDIPTSHPDTAVIQRAVIAAGMARPRPPIFRRLRGDMRTAKHVWGAELLSAMSRDPECRARLLAHPIIVRLREISTR